MTLIEKLSADPGANVARRPTLEIIAREGSIGRSRMSELYRMFHVHGPGHGTMLSLPFDQLVEHGVGHTLKWERSADPRAVIELGNSGYFSAMVLSIGQAEKYQTLIRPDLPLIVKVDGHFLVGKEVPYPRHSLMSSVERAVAAGANAIGFTFFIGGEETQQDVERVAHITGKAHEHGKPVFMWAYARGPLPQKMGTDSLFWCAQGISAGESIGVDVVKQKFPAPVKDLKTYSSYLGEVEGEKGYFYSKMPEVEKLLELEPAAPNAMTTDLHVKRLNFMADVAPNTLKIISGGPKSKDPQKDLIETTRAVMDSGNEGRIVGRNLWGRPLDEGLELAREIVAIMQESSYRRTLNEARFKGQESC
jgi:class I fructose-bisphosphate aldolase